MGEGRRSSTDRERESKISISRANYMVHSPLLGLGKKELVFLFLV
jgi:hypothetical protein